MSYVDYPDFVIGYKPNFIPLNVVSNTMVQASAIQKESKVTMSPMEFGNDKDGTTIEFWVRLLNTPTLDIGSYNFFHFPF